MRMNDDDDLVAMRLAVIDRRLVVWCSMEREHGECPHPPDNWLLDFDQVAGLVAWIAATKPEWGDAEIQREAWFIEGSYAHLRPSLGQRFPAATRAT